MAIFDKDMVALAGGNAPPAEEPGVAHHTKADADAEAAEEGLVSRAAKKLKEAMGQ